MTLWCHHLVADSRTTQDIKDSFNNNIITNVKMIIIPSDLII